MMYNDFIINFTLKGQIQEILYLCFFYQTVVLEPMNGGLDG